MHKDWETAIINININIINSNININIITINININIHNVNINNNLLNAINLLLLAIQRQPR